MIALYNHCMYLKVCSKDIILILVSIKFVLLTNWVMNAHFLFNLAIST